jgi:NADPH-dependent 2,4-dienoyl-CoA reductase/sulfur reductase-like enzyme
MLEALPTKGPDLAAGFSLDQLGDGIPMEGHFQGEPVLPVAIDGTHVALSNGDRLAADVVVMGAGVTPERDLAEKAGLEVDRGVKVNAFLETSSAGIFAASDIARWPDPHSGALIRVEHWAVAQRQGQTAARNMLGAREPFVAVPFFWSAHFDVTVAYVGHAESWDRVAIDGDAKARDCRVEYWKGDKRLAVATVNRDRASLRAEAEMEMAVCPGENRHA